MINFNTPIDFSERQEIGDFLIEYSNLIEICQGGPVIGNIKINKKTIASEYKFGSPLIVFENMLFIPIYIKKFFKSGFKLCKINLTTLNITEIGTLKDLIYLDKIEEGKLYYFEDVTKSRSNYFEMTDLM
ncbi:MAG: hypothetical protein PHQ65_11735 [Bacteroidales bacterium]|nr:hypothetical protein [Bacteroidales bacterium]MDD3665928.1 hypothetical protein [Bacteroidales bacterium]